MPYSKLRSFLEQRGGAVAFADFMAEALYGPEGYYAKHIQTVGRGGDFSTSATLSPLLGLSIAAWLRQAWATDGWCGNVIEIGPGDGSLSAQVRQSLGWWQRRRLRWHFVETSPVLRAQQQQRLRGGGVTWHDSMEQALAACGGAAMIFSNEVPDAFPVTLLESQDGAWQEVWLEINAVGGLVETIRPWAGMNFLNTVLRPLEGSFRPAQRVELPSAWASWLAGWHPGWKSGRMLTIDYGGLFADVYARRPAGTLRAYLRHERKTGIRIYESMGRQDITADVWVDDLIRIGALLGLENLGWKSQRQFITELAGRPPKTREEVQLLDESGAGAAFFVLEQRAGGARK